jgi:hypothetical protein
VAKKADRRGPAAPYAERGAGKTPRSAAVWGSEKRPRGAEPSAGGAAPLWAFRVVDLGGPWCWSALDGSGLRVVLQRLKEMETMTWSSIESGTGSHFVDVGSLSKPARDRLAIIQQDDTDALFSLRITGRRRVWGIRASAVLKVLWWDPLHEVCPSPKKHT